MNIEEYASCDAIALAALVRGAQVTPREVRDAALAAVAVVNPQVNAVVDTWQDEPLASGDVNGDAPLVGVPFLVKDLAITARGKRTEAGSRFASGLTASNDSDLMTWFRAAGMTPIGRTTTPELAISTTTEPIATGATRNPWDTGRTAGGSSGGAGAAVAAGCVPIAHGTDAGGSLRVPASSNGVFALKPSRGRVPNGPAFDEIWSGVGVQFALTRSVRDSAALLDAVGRPGTGEPFVIAPPTRPYLDEVAQEPGTLRIALMRDPLNGQGSDPAVRNAVDEVAELCSQLGHIVENVVPELGMSWEAFTHAYARIEAANTTAMLDGIAARLGKCAAPDDLEPATWAMVEYGRSISATDLLGAFDARNTATRRIGAFLAQWDALLSPTLAELPLAIGEYNRPQATLDGLGWARYVSDRAPFSSLANVAGLPAMSVPLSMDEATGLPIGCQFIAGFGREDLLLRLAGQLERASPWAARRPPVWAGGTVDRRG